MRERVLAVGLMLGLAVTGAMTGAIPGAMPGAAAQTMQNPSGAPGAAMPGKATTMPGTAGTNGVPAHGANSFTRTQAAARIAARGFSDVGGLQKDSVGVWRGKAKKDGAPVAVWLDYKGNVGSN